MNQSFTMAHSYQPVQALNPSYINLNSFAPLSIQNPSFNPSGLLNTHFNPLFNLSGSNITNINPLVYQSQLNQLALLQQKQQQNQLENLLRNQELSIQNQIHNLRLLEQIQNTNPFDSVKQSLKKPFEKNIPLFFNNHESHGIKEELSSCVTEDTISDKESPIRNKASNGGNLKTQIEEMVRFFLQEFGKADQSKMLAQRKTYNANQVLLEVFDALSSKYSSSGKCREDMTRFVLRKAMSYLRNRERNDKGFTCKAASLALCKKYFEIKSDDNIAQNVDIENEEEILGFLLPYKKNSRNRTANTCFITEIFASEAFYQDYNGFLENFDKIFEEDNKKKFKKLVDFLLTMIKEKRVENLKDFKRLPWLKTWLSSTKIIAEELRNASNLTEMNKKTKEAKVKKVKA